MHRKMEKSTPRVPCKAWGCAARFFNFSIFHQPGLFFRGAALLEPVGAEDKIALAEVIQNAIGQGGGDEGDIVLQVYDTALGSRRAAGIGPRATAGPGPARP